MPASPIDIAHLRSWIGRQDLLHDSITQFPVAALAATLDRDDADPQPGDVLPPLWHWLYFLPRARQSQLGADGHPQRGGFLPPVALPRRMWAGGRLQFPGTLRVGDPVTRTSTVADVSLKEGRTGPLVFVLVRHEIAGPDGVAVTEEHDIVYRGLPGPREAPPTPRAAPEAAAWRRDITPDDVLLFRYSALTFNGHRIHYDRRYVTQAEAYPGLVVHGPLLATLLADLVRRNTDRRLAAFRFRAASPVFDTTPFALCGQAEGDRAALWVRRTDGTLAMEAEATLE